MEDTLILDGTGVLSGGSCNGVNDHRMVMSAALASLISTADVTVSDRGAIAKSYPRFFDDFSVFGVRDADEFH
jgi:3-phosphoshikimate 1-carboxyvinyltransferase